MLTAKMSKAEFGNLLLPNRADIGMTGAFSP
jgi:hypothetical protein